MQIITLINDWKSDNLYSSQIKGQLLSVSDNLNLVNLVSQVVSFDLNQAAFILKNSYKSFPKGTIHLNFVDNPNIKSDAFIIAQFSGQFFVSKDNGFLSIVLPSNSIDKCFKIDSDKTVFEEKFLYKKIVSAILNKKLNKIAHLTGKINRSITVSPAVTDTQIIVHCIYIDVYGNLITNLRKKQFYDFIGENDFKIIIQSEKNMIEKISSNYSDVDNGDLLALFNSADLLEIAQKNGSIAEIYGIKRQTEIRIEKVIKTGNKKQGLIF